MPRSQKVVLSAAELKYLWALLLGERALAGQAQSASAYAQAAWVFAQLREVPLSQQDMGRVEADLRRQRLLYQRGAARLTRRGRRAAQLSFMRVAYLQGRRAFKA